LYRSADIVCVPSRSDTLPTGVMEAMICGVPVIGARTGGIPFMVDHDRTGILFEPGNAGELAAAIANLAADARRSREMGVAGRHRAMEEFGWNNIGKKIDFAVRRAVSAQR
jgi:glycosyltransferase involved in cell wall biosynthesis